MPVRVDFYLLDSATLPARQTFVCKLVDKAYQQGHRLYIHVAEYTEAQQLNDLLWTFNDISFVPHALCTTDLVADHASKPPILIGYEAIPENAGEILINLTMKTPENPHQFQRIIEVVPLDPICQEQARSNYKSYRALSFELFTHDLKK
jgi:DNA polymerase-3 subunit chi